MKALFSLWLCAATLLPATLSSQQQPSLQERLLGTWEGSGSLFGQPARFAMEWENPMGQKFLSLKFMNSFSDSSGKERTMEAIAYYQLSSGKGYWFDSRGEVLPLTFQISGDTLTVLWGDASTEQGKTTYLLRGDQAETADYISREQTYTPFGSATYRKIEE